MKWRASLTQEPARAAALMGRALGGLTLAEREKLLTSELSRDASEAWKIAIRPALEAARAEKKIVLFFQLVGDLDLEGC